MFRQPTAEKDTIYSFYPFEFDLYDEQEIELRRLVELVRESVEYDWISCFKVDLFSGELSEVALQEKGFNLIESIRFDAGNGLSAWVAKQQRPVLLSAVHKSQRFRSNPVKSFICCPVIRNGETIGVLNLGHSRVNAYTKVTLDRLISLVNGND